MKVVSNTGGRRRAPKRPGSEAGVIGIMFAGALIIIFGFFSLSLDLSLHYNRRMELQNVADTAALAAANQLDGTKQGVLNALQAASDRFSATAGSAPTYQYGKKTLVWQDKAMEFGSSPQGPWQTADAAKAQASGLLFVKVDTSGLDEKYGKLNTLFLQFFTASSETSTSARAVAGRSAIKVTPLGICAMRDEAHRNHNNELEEFGFRRGVSYDLLDLNRPDATAGQTYIVNPIASTTAITDVQTLAPFVCTGTMAMTRIMGGKVTVSPGFPLASLYYHLNSRFGSYTAPSYPCDSRTAPPDVNIKEYPYNGSGSWMGKTPAGQSAALLRSDDRRWTITGPDVPPSGVTDVQFGPLWAYAKAVPYASYDAKGEPEPAGGYTTYEITDWSTLYAPATIKTSTTTTYPPVPDTPYSYKGSTTFSKSPTTGLKSVANRRVLNLPLLACPVSGSKASVVGIGRFFMTVAASDKTLYGEFAGLVPEQALGTQIELHP
jgi:hypothetical protein